MKAKILLLYLCGVIHPLHAQTALERALQHLGPEITASEGTTRLLGPLDMRGDIDYVAAINEQQREGVEPRDNFIVALWRYFPIEKQLEDKDLRERYLELLGAEPDERTPGHPQFVALGEFLAKRVADEPINDEATQELLRWCARHHWGGDDAPMVAQWLEENKASLDGLVRASRRTKLYSPFVSPTRFPVDLPLPHIEPMRDAVLALAARANQSEDFSASWTDIQACFRLSRLAAKGRTLVEGLVGVASDSYGSRSAASLARRATVRQLERMSADLERFAPGYFNLRAGLETERLLALDGLVQSARRGPRFYREFTLGDDDPGLFDVPLHLAYIEIKQLLRFDNLRHLPSLSLQESYVTKKGMELLPKFRNLQRLDLTATDIEADWLKPVSQLPSLTSLNLTGCQLSSETLAAAGRLKTLLDLELSGAKVDSEGLHHLGRLGRLESLDLAVIRCQPDGVPLDLSFLKDLSELTELRLFRTQIRNGDLRPLVRCAKLETIDLGEANVTDASVRRLRALPRLRRLDLDSPWIEGRAELFETLAEMKSLKALALPKELESNRHLRAFQKRRPTVDVTLR